MTGIKQNSRTGVCLTCELTIWVILEQGGLQTIIIFITQQCATNDRQRLILRVRKAKF